MQCLHGLHELAKMVVFIAQHWYVCKICKNIMHKVQKYIKVMMSITFGYNITHHHIKLQLHDWWKLLLHETVHKYINIYAHAVPGA